MASDPASRARILRLSRMGANAQAWTAFGQDGWAGRADFDAVLLTGRLRKADALRAPPAERPALLRAAADDYAAAAALRRSPYALINAASLAWLGGDRATGSARAEAVLAMLDSGDHEADLPYWLGATRAEALLVLGRMDGSAAALRTAIAQSPGAWEDRAITLHQFETLLGAAGAGRRWLDAFRPGPVLAWRGVMALAPDDAAAKRQVDEAVAALAPSAGFGALAAGADILVAEALIERGAECHVVLPCDAETFRAASVVAVDPGWGPRFDQLLDAATSLEIVSAVAAVPAAAIELGDAIAAGMAIGHAQTLATTPVALRLRGEDDPPAADDIQARWTAAGLRLESVALKRTSGAVAGGTERGLALRAILAVRGDASPPAESATVRAEGKATFACTDLAEAFATVAAILRERRGAGGIDVRLCLAPAMPADLAPARHASASAVSAGVVATRAAAAVARLYLPGLRADLMGELRTAFGSEEVWRLGLD